LESKILMMISKFFESLYIKDHNVHEMQR